MRGPAAFSPVLCAVSFHFDLLAVSLPFGLLAVSFHFSLLAVSFHSGLPAVSFYSGLLAVSFYYGLLAVSFYFSPELKPWPARVLLSPGIDFSLSWHATKDYFRAFTTKLQKNITEKQILCLFG